MPSTEAIPAPSGTTVNVSRRTSQDVVIVGPVVVFGGFQLGGVNQNLSLPGMGKFRVTLLLYPEYDTGVGVYLARNYLAWRVVGAMGPISPPPYLGLVAGTLGVAPVTPALALPIGIPTSFVVDPTGYSQMRVEFDTSGGVAAPGQGLDQVLVTLSAVAG